MGDISGNKNYIFPDFFGHTHQDHITRSEHISLGAEILYFENALSTITMPYIGCLIDELN